MRIVVLKDDNIDITEEQVLKKLRLDQLEGCDDTKELALKLFQEAKQIAKPKAAYGIAEISEKGEGFVRVEGSVFSSELVRKNLEKSDRIYPYLGTCGRELHDWSMQFTDLFEQFMADGIKELFLFHIVSILRSTVKNAYYPNADISKMSPGSLAAWPITQQPQIFNLFGPVAEEIGVTLTKSFLIVPQKSVSGFFFSAAKHYENCTLCPMENCPGRRAPRQI